MHEINGYEERYFFKNLKYEWNQTVLALTILAAGSAAFYIYHYLQYFAKIFLSKIKTFTFWLCVFLIFWGMASIILALLANGLWVTWLAIEWIIIALLHYTLSKRKILNEKAKIRLKEEAILYVFIIIVLIGMNIVVPLLSDNLLPWFIMFVIFVCSTIRRHINIDWMLAKLGSFVDLRPEEKVNK